MILFSSLIRRGILSSHLPLQQQLEQGLQQYDLTFNDFNDGTDNDATDESTFRRKVSPGERIPFGDLVIVTIEPLQHRFQAHCIRNFREVIKS